MSRQVSAKPEYSPFHNDGSDITEIMEWVAGIWMGKIMELFLLWSALNCLWQIWSHSCLKQMPWLNLSYEWFHNHINSFWQISELFFAHILTVCVQFPNNFWQMWCFCCHAGNLHHASTNIAIVCNKYKKVFFWTNMMSPLSCWRSVLRLAEQWRDIGRWQSRGWRRRRERQKWPDDGNSK